MALKPGELSRLKQLLANELQAKRKDIWRGSIGGMVLAIFAFIAVSAVLYIVIGMSFVVLKFIMFTGMPEQEWGTFRFVYAMTFLLFCFVIFVVMAIVSKWVWPRLSVNLPETPRLFLDDAEAPSETPGLYSRLLHILFALPRYARVMLTNLLLIRRMDLTPREVDLAALYILALEEPVPFEELTTRGEGYTEKQRKSVLAILARLDYVHLKQRPGQIFVSRAMNSDRVFEEIERERRARKKTIRSIGYGTG